jgi:CrcB protein
MGVRLVRTVGELPIDPDVEPLDRIGTRARIGSLAQSGAGVLRSRWDILAVISLGGAVGSAARWALAEAFPTAAGGFPWATFAVNLSGAFALAVLMVVVNEVLPASRYVRPLLGVGVLGGYTTFSTYMLDTRELLVAGHQQLAAVYLLGTLTLGLVAVWLGLALTRATVGLLRRRLASRHQHRAGDGSRGTSA